MRLLACMHMTFFVWLGTIWAVLSYTRLVHVSWLRNCLLFLSIEMAMKKGGMCVCDSVIITLQTSIEVSSILSQALLASGTTHTIRSDDRSYLRF